jgi:hypothetical protein
MNNELPSRDSYVSKVAGYGLDGWDSVLRRGREIVPFATTHIPDVGPHLLL